MMTPNPDNKNDPSPPSTRRPRRAAATGGRGLFASIDKWKRDGERFGVGVAAATAVMAVVSMYRGRPGRMDTLAVVSSVALASALILPQLLYPFSWALETIFKLVTKSLMYLLLVLTFYLVFAPAGIALRILGKDPLDRKIDKQRDSYWLERKPVDPKKAEKQY